MIKTLKQTISNLYYWIKKKLVRLKNWLILIIFGAAVVAAPLVLPNVPDVALEKIQQKYEKSELKGKYRLEKTAFILDAIDENAIQTEVGNKNLDEFVPELTLRKWDDEVNFKVKYKHGEKEKDQKVDIEDKKIKWKGKKTEVHYYDIKKGELLHDKVLEHDVYEVEVILLEKPDTNIVSFDIETKGLSFYYQPELTQEEIDEGAFRPENVIGSYAVYHKSKQGDYSKMGKKNYRAGKAFHIYRPKIIDSAGTEVWGKLNITDNLLTVEILQEFLDNAVYPVRHAAGLTFGYTSVGSTEAAMSGGVARGSLGSPASDGIMTSISVYLGGSVLTKTALFNSDGTLIIGNNTGWNPPDQAWSENNMTDTNVFSATTYAVVMKRNSSANWYYDITGDGGKYTTDAYANNWGNLSFSNTTRKYSIFATYTAGGAEERRMFLVE